MNGTGAATIDLPVRKRGRTTGLTSGAVSSIDLTTSVDYPRLGTVVFRDQVEITADEPQTDVQPGFFLFTPWSTAPTTTVGDVTVERFTSGPSMGITVSWPNGIPLPTERCWATSHGTWSLVRLLVS